MIVKFERPLIKTDPWVSETFTDVLNAVCNATSPAEAHGNIIRLCIHNRGPNPHRYYKWGFDTDRFWLQQWSPYKPEGLFRDRLFTVLSYTSQKLLPKSD